MTTEAAPGKDLPSAPGSTDLVPFWLVTWIGVALAGSEFGMIVGLSEGDLGAAFAGFFAGMIVAGVFAVPVVITVATLSWALWLSRFALAVATLSGACTGFISSSLLFSGAPAYFSLIALATCIGGLVTGLIALPYWKKSGHTQHYVTDHIWQYSLRDLFFRFTVLTLMVAIWSSILTLIL
jgi:hypothetical protein